MCHQDSRAAVSVEEAGAAEECMMIYCKPLEFCNVLMRRAKQNPSFLRRCLRYRARSKTKGRSGNSDVIFSYRDRNGLLRKSEVTQGFSCPFCLMACVNFKGLRYHLISTHDIFRFEFWVSDEYRAINVSVKVDDLQAKDIANETKPRSQPISYCSRPLKRRRLRTPQDKAKDVHLYEVEPSCILNTSEHMHSDSTKKDEGNEVPGSSCNGDHLETPHASCASANLENLNLISISAAQTQSTEDRESFQNASTDQSSILPSLPNVKRKLSLERADSRNGVLLQKRQFYHSHRVQPMAMDLVFADKDSEDEVDYDIADLEDRRMLDDFVDVTKDEKHLMHLWNSFVRKQRVLADGHIPWACEAFLHLHGEELVQDPVLSWCWRMFMIKLWNHGLVDAGALDNCGMILDKFQEKATTKSKDD